LLTTRTWETIQKGSAAEIADRLRRHAGKRSYLGLLSGAACDQMQDVPVLLATGIPMAAAVMLETPPECTRKLT
jgi:hypothetical protein